MDILLDEVPFFESVAGRPLEAACAGEDFVLLFGAGGGGDFADIGCTRVGLASEGPGGLRLISGGRVVSPSSCGYEHFGRGAAF